MRLAHDADRELEELREYLGDGFDLSLLQRSSRAVEEELARAASEEELYRTSTAYLYDLTAFAMSPTKLPYLEMLTAEVQPPARILDYGCGIGSDGLLLAEAGYDVEFADFANPSTAYLRWRLRRRGIEAVVHDLDAGPLPGGFDLAYSFDVIEHVPEPEAFLDRLEGLADRVLVNFLEPEPGDTSLHHDLPVARLVARCARRRLRRYEVLHGRSHVVLYATELARPQDRLRGAALRLRQRLKQ